MLDGLVGGHDTFQSRSVRLGSGATEHYITITAEAGLALNAQIEDVATRYLEAQRALGLKPDTAIFRRIFVSDAANQASAVSTSTLCRNPESGPVAVSIVQQPPLPGSKIALLAYHVEGAGTTKRQLSPHHTMVERNGVRHLWTSRVCAGALGSTGSVEEQTRALFGELVDRLSAEGATLADNCVRTWFYVKDVDVFYQGFVKARGELFRKHELTENTHYIASTGIEGGCSHQHDLVLMDAYSLLDIEPRQLSYLQALDKLCPTKDYKVHFERGTKLSFGDRAHHYISGTASIDSAGRVVHPCNVGRQLERALTNVDALLASGGARLSDMSHLLVYLRDSSDYARVQAALSERMPGVPAIFLKAPVCRPEWLVEVEGIAITGEHAPGFANF